MVTNFWAASAKIGILHRRSVCCIHNGWENRNMNAQVNTADDSLYIWQNLVNFGSVIPEVCRCVCAGRVTRWVLRFCHAFLVISATASDMMRTFGIVVGRDHAFGWWASTAAGYRTWWVVLARLAGQQAIVSPRVAFDAGQHRLDTAAELTRLHQRCTVHSGSVGDLFIIYYENRTQSTSKRFFLSKNSQNCDF